MCILLSTTEHPDYPLLLLSNRDEFFARPTMLAHFRPLGTTTRILSPLDYGRSEHGSWIGVTSTGKLAVLVNYRESDTVQLMSEVSRGILPLDYLTSEVPDQVWTDTLEECLSQKVLGNVPVSLSKIGGFSLVYGQLKIDEKTGHIEHLNILSNRGDHGRVHDSKLMESEDVHSEISRGTTFGLSNSLFYQPWDKVTIGKQKLKETVAEAVEKKYHHDTLIDKCFEVLSYNTFDEAKADSATDINEKFLELRKSVFIPPLNTHTKVTPVSGTYYGTRTQTVIALTKEGVLHYYERDLHSSDNVEQEVKQHHYSFPIRNKE